MFPVHLIISKQCTDRRTGMSVCIVGMTVLFVFVTHGQLTAAAVTEWKGKVNMAARNGGALEKYSLWVLMNDRMTWSPDRAAKITYRIDSRVLPPFAFVRRMEQRCSVLCCKIKWLSWCVCVWSWLSIPWWPEPCPIQLSQLQRLFGLKIFDVYFNLFDLYCTSILTKCPKKMCFVRYDTFAWFE